MYYFGGVLLDISLLVTFNYDSARNSYIVQWIDISLILLIVGSCLLKCLYALITDIYNALKGGIIFLLNGQVEKKPETKTDEIKQEIEKNASKTCDIKNDDNSGKQLKS